MAEYLLTSEKFVKEVSSISDNLAGKYVLPSIREAQEVSLKSILGSCLLNKLKDLGLAGELNLPENAQYKDLHRGNYEQSFLQNRELWRSEVERRKPYRRNPGRNRQDAILLPEQGRLLCPGTATVAAG